MNQQELIQRADTALSELISGGGYMQPAQANRFIRKIMDVPTIFNSARQITMNRPKMELNKIGFGSRVLRLANQGTISSPRTGEEGTRALSRADRAKPDFSKITLETTEYIAEIDLPYEVLEDNIEGGSVDGTQFQDTIMELMAQRVALDLEELVLLADTGLSGSDPYLGSKVGIILQAVTNVVNHGGDPMNPDLFADMIKALPGQYHRLLNQYRFYVSRVKEIDYRMTVAQRQTNLGDSILTGRSPVAVLGVPLDGIGTMPNTNALLTIPRNLIIGVQRQIRIEMARDVRERVIIIVITLRADFKFEEEDMVVKATNIG